MEKVFRSRWRNDSTEAKRSSHEIDQSLQDVLGLAAAVRDLSGTNAVQGALQSHPSPRIVGSLPSQRTPPQTKRRSPAQVTA
jgi:hypothetical protein